MEQKLMQNIHKIGVIILGLFGDVLIRTPILKNLREMFPGAKIVAIVDTIGVEVLRHNPHINHTIAFHRNKNKLKNNLFKIYDIWQVRKEKFDLLVNIYDGGSSPLVSRLSGAPHRLGITKRSRGTYTMTHPILRQSHEKHHIGLNFLKVLHPLNKPIDFDTKPVFVIPPATRKTVYARFKNIDFQNTYLINFGSGGVEKIMDFKKYFQLVQYLYKNYKLIPAIIQNPAQEHLQKEFIQEFLQKSHIPYHALPLLSLHDLGALMQNMRFFITPDTGLLHMAIALDIKTLAIFTYTNPKLVDPETQNFVACFKPDFSKVQDSLYFGAKELDTDYLCDRADKLLAL
jgi:ADP-heptose:LPS heptosyltransferase